MTITLRWDDSKQELWVTLAGQVSLTEIAEHIPEVRDYLDRDATRVDKEKLLLG